jgi:hypothetical protein
LDTDKITTKSRFKFSKLSYLLLLGAVIVVVGTANFTFAAPLSQLIANPGSTLGNKATQYGATFTTPTAGTIKSIEVQFISGTLVSVGDFANIVVVDPITGVAITGTNLGTTTFSGDLGATPKLIYTFTNAITTTANTDWSVFIIKIRNPDVTSNTSGSFSVTTKDSIGTIIDGPTSATYSVSLLYNADSILNAINSKTGDICIGAGCPVL